MCTGHLHLGAFAIIVNSNKCCLKIDSACICMSIQCIIMSTVTATNTCLLDFLYLRTSTTTMITVRAIISRATRATIPPMIRAVSSVINNSLLHYIDNNIDIVRNDNTDLW